MDALLATQRLDSLASHLSLLVILLTVAVLSRMQVIFPVMILLGPLIIAQYLYWRRHGPGQATWQYLQTEPR
jgi:hypothetical protein